MTEETTPLVPQPHAGDTADQQSESPTPLAWEMLQQAREAKGVHLVAISAALKVPLVQLQALEAGRMEALPDAVFARALAASVCRHLQIDSREIMEAWPRPEQIQFRNLHEPARMTPVAFHSSQSSPALKWFVVAAATVLCFGLVGWWLANPQSVINGFARDDATYLAESSVTAVLGEPKTLQVEEVSDGPAGAMVEGDADVASTEPVASNGPDQSRGAAVEAAAPAPAAAAVDASPASSQVGTEALEQKPALALAGGPTESNAGVDEQRAPKVDQLTAPPPGTLGLVLHARETAWVEVKSMDGEVLLNRIMQPGTYHLITSGAPWSLVLGNAPGTSVTRDGRDIDFSANTRQRVARFEVE